ncbi:ubiquitin C-terminal hydrolase [Phakopsora pachyrhizi]|nr:ubiquitin C-terminal hydrolase [Phakopsora pachyrhizi]
MTISVSVKHGGKKYELELDITKPPTVFKQQIHRLTAVEPSKQKILIKGGQLKDDSDWKELSIKPDMSEVQLAEALNMGNTCYLNSTVQLLRSIPELQKNLNQYNGSSSDALRKDSALASSLRDTYKDLIKSSESYSPFDLIRTLRSYAPQFAQQTQGHFSQQDAEECWVQILTAIRSTLDNSTGINEKFVEQYMTGEITTETKCIEVPEETPTISKERFLELKCNISISTNHMITGIQDGLQQPLEKNSPTLGRSAQYMQTSKISRLPSYLTVHMVRFYWRRDINKKTKIMRKVKFPFSLDLVELLTEDLKKRVSEPASRIKEIEKDRRERIKTQKKKKIALEASSKDAKEPTTGGSIKNDESKPKEDHGDVPMAVDSQEDESEEDESAIREREAAILMSLIDPDLAKDTGTNPTAQYELCGIVTHKGASADGGHYMAWVRCDLAKSNPNLPTSPNAEQKTNKPLDFQDPDEQEWYKFDDEKVSIVKREKILSLDGGGEDSTAYILLYKSMTL